VQFDHRRSEDVDFECRAETDERRLKGEWLILANATSKNARFASQDSSWIEAIIASESSHWSCQKASVGTKARIAAPGANAILGNTAMLIECYGIQDISGSKSPRSWKTGASLSLKASKFDISEEI